MVMKNLKQNLLNVLSVYLVVFRVRGTFLSALYTVENFGILLAYIIGNFFEFYAMPLVSIILTAIFATLLLFIPESPTFLVRKNKIDVSEMKTRD